MRVLIVDDEELARAVLRELLAAHPEVEIVGEAANGFAAVKLAEELAPDLLFLDIQMPKLSGFEVMELLGEKVAGIFVTASDEFALKAFDVHAVDYLLKPVEPARLKKALDRAREKGALKAFRAEVKKAKVARLAITTRQGVVLVDPLTISHAVLEDELVTVFAGDQQYLTDYSLQELADRLPADKFERVHRRALLNLEHVQRLEPIETGGYFARTRHGHSVEVSRQAARDLRKRLGLRKAPDDD